MLQFKHFPTLAVLVLVIAVTGSFALTASLTAQVENPKPVMKSQAETLSEQRVVDVVYRGVFSDNKLVRERALDLFAKNSRLLHQVKEGNQLELVKSAIKDGDEEIVRTALTILLKSSIADAERNSILIDLLGSKQPSIRQRVLNVLRQNQEQVLKQVISTIKNDLTGSHTNELRLVECLGPNASQAVPVIIENYNARLEQAKKIASSKKQGSKNQAIDYLQMVYAVAEIGPAAKKAMPIALAAAEEKGIGDRAAYPIAGMMCIANLLGNESHQSTVDKLLATVDPNTVEKYRKYAQSLITQYDKDKDGLLSNIEMARMRRTPAGADFNKDGQLTENELVLSLSGLKGTGQVIQTRASIRQAVEKSLKQK